jgi:hypothetical protein
MTLAVEARFKEVDREDIQDVLNLHEEKLLNEELIQLEKYKEMKMFSLTVKILK